MMQTQVMLRVCSFFVLLSVAPVGATDISGRIRVVDGDTIKVSGKTVRLHGIDAPESDQKCITKEGADWLCGGWVKRVVYDRYDGRRAICKSKTTDRYGRIVARCFVGKEDIAAWLVSEGMAFAYRKYSHDYVELEKQAVIFNRGLHAVSLQSPAKHRQSRHIQQKPPSKCKIKGNISASGRIYHVPGQRDYDRTGIDEASGERWFCSDKQARSAGWRRARR